MTTDSRFSTRPRCFSSVVRCCGLCSEAADSVIEAVVPVYEDRKPGRVVCGRENDPEPGTSGSFPRLWDELWIRRQVIDLAGESVGKELNERLLREVSRNGAVGCKYGHIPVVTPFHQPESVTDDVFS